MDIPEGEEEDDFERFVAKCKEHYKSNLPEHLTLYENNVVAVLAEQAPGIYKVMHKSSIGFVSAHCLEQIPAPSGTKAKVVVEYDAIETQFLPLVVGDDVIVTKQEERWWTGYSNGHMGIFPPSCVKPVEEENGKNIALAPFSAILLDRPGFPLALKLLETFFSSDGVDQKNLERLTTSMVVLFENKGVVIPLLLAVSQEEVSKTLSMSTLFRQNSATSAVLKIITRMFGRPFLNFTLRPLIVEIYSSGKSYEVDKNRIDKKDKKQSIKTNIKNLTQVCEVLFDRVVASLPSIPVVFVHIVQVLLLVTSEKFRGSQGVVLSGFFFLRFLCPAIISPELFGINLEKKLTPADQRALVLVSKVIQNLANGVEFGGKEPYMVPLNSFLKQYRPKFEEFLSSLANGDVDQRGNIERAPTLTPTDMKNHLEIVHSGLVRCQTNVFKRIADETFLAELKEVMETKIEEDGDSQAEALDSFFRRPSQLDMGAAREARQLLDPASKKSSYSEVYAALRDERLKMAPPPLPPGPPHGGVGSMLSSSTPTLNTGGYSSIAPPVPSLPTSSPARSVSPVPPRRKGGSMIQPNSPNMSRNRDGARSGSAIGKPPRAPLPNPTSPNSQSLPSPDPRSRSPTDALHSRKTNSPVQGRNRPPPPSPRGPSPRLQRPSSSHGEVVAAGRGPPPAQPPRPNSSTHAPPPAQPPRPNSSTHVPGPLPPLPPPP